MSHRRIRDHHAVELGVGGHGLYERGRALVRGGDRSRVDADGVAGERGLELDRDARVGVVDGDREAGDVARRARDDDVLADLEVELDERRAALDAVDREQRAADRRADVDAALRTCARRARRRSPW